MKDKIVVLRESTGETIARVKIRHFPSVGDVVAIEGREGRVQAIRHYPVAFHSRGDEAKTVIVLEAGTPSELSASEALYGFAGWLTTRDTAVTFSAKHDAALAADLVNAFVGANGLESPRDGWEKQLKHPKP